MRPYLIKSSWAELCQGSQSPNPITMRYYNPLDLRPDLKFCVSVMWAGAKFVARKSKSKSHYNAIFLLTGLLFSL